MSKELLCSDFNNITDLIGKILNLVDVARSEGILALEERVVSSCELESLVVYAAKLIADGTDPHQLKGILNRIAEAERTEGYESLKNLIIIEGMLALQQGEDRNFIELKLSSYLGLDYSVKTIGEIENRGRIARIAFFEKLKSQNLRQECKTFDDFFDALDIQSIKMILREVDIWQIEDALMFCDVKTAEKIMECMSRRISNTVVANMEVRSLNIEMSLQSQKEIMNTWEKMKISK